MTDPVNEPLSDPELAEIEVCGDEGDWADRLAVDIYQLIRLRTGVNMNCSEHDEVAHLLRSRVAIAEATEQDTFAKLLAIKAVLAPHKREGESYYDTACRVDTELTATRQRIAELEGLLRDIYHAAEYGDENDWHGVAARLRYALSPTTPEQEEKP